MVFGLETTTKGEKESVSKGEEDMRGFIGKKSQSRHVPAILFH